MICYRDRTFCASPNCKNKCGRELTDEIKRQASEWWLSFTNGRTSIGAPIAMAFFCDKDGEVIK